MLANERYKIILKLLSEKPSITSSELAERFDVSMETVRRDLAYLDAHNRLLRVHGGAMAKNEDKQSTFPLEHRITNHTDAKRELAKNALQLVSERDVIAIDSGSTAIEFAEALCEHFRELTILTYSWDVMQIITQKSSFGLRAIGGDYLPEERLFCGFLTEESLNRLRASKCFLCPSAVSLRHGIAITIKEYYNLHNAMMRISDHTYVLADSSKIEATAPIRLCDAGDVDAIITDSGVDDQIAQLYSEHGIELYRNEKNPT